MGNVFLIKSGNDVRHFYNEADMKTEGFTKADRIITEEVFHSNGCYARIIDGDIVVGKTEAEQQAETVAEQLVEIDIQLEALDKKYLTPRILCGIGRGDAYALKCAEEHETAAALLREKRKALMN